MKKRFLILPLLLAILALLASCVRIPEDPVEAIGAAVKKTFPGGMDLTFSLSGGVDAVNRESMKIELRTNGDRSLVYADCAAAEQQNTVWKEKGVYYIRDKAPGMDEIKYKAGELVVSHSEIYAMDVLTLIDAFRDEAVFSQWEELLSRAVTEKTSGGNLYTVTVPAGGFPAFFEKTQGAGNGSDEHPSALKSAEIKLAVSSKLLLTSVEVNAVIDGADEIEIRCAVTVNHPGEKVELVLPDEVIPYLSREDVLFGGETEDPGVLSEDAQYLAAYLEIIKFYDENGNRVSDYDERIAALKEMYLPDQVDQAAAELESIMNAAKE